MTPFSSVAMLEKLALLSIAFCKAPVLSNASWRRSSVMPCALRHRRHGWNRFLFRTCLISVYAYDDPERELRYSSLQQKLAAPHSRKTGQPLARQAMDHRDLYTGRLCADAHRPVDGTGLARPGVLPDQCPVKSKPRLFRLRHPPMRGHAIRIRRHCLRRLPARVS